MWVHPSAQKYFARLVGQINSTTPAILSHQGALAIVANEGQGAVDAAARKTNGLQRTVKSCGPDAPVLASSRVEVKASRDDGGKKAGHQGELV
jgi:hypothetical protein